MFPVEKDRSAPKPEFYARAAEQLQALIHDERDFIANAANMAALIYHLLADLNWAGFYIHKEGELVLGPFQGKPACIRIAFGRGVCGTAAADRETVLVDDVHSFAGHIACDAASRSEIVIPLIDRKSERLIGVLDLDSPKRARFDADDRAGLEKMVAIFLERTDLEDVG